MKTVLPFNPIYMRVCLSKRLLLISVMTALQFQAKSVIILQSLMICGLPIVNTIAASIMTTVRNVIFVTFASPQKILCANTVIRWHAPSLVLTTRRRFALSFQMLPMYVMAVTQLVDVLFKKSSTMPRKLSLIMNVLLAIPVLV